MRDAEIDRILASEEDVLPSPGFHASVMEAVHREATTPRPIPFPWRRAWPAFVSSALVLVGSPFLLESNAVGPDVLESLLSAAKSSVLPWIALAAFATFGSLLLARRLAEERY